MSVVPFVDEQGLEGQLLRVSISASNKSQVYHSLLSCVLFSYFSAVLAFQVLVVKGMKIPGLVTLKSRYRRGFSYI